MWSLSTRRIIKNQLTNMYVGRFRYDTRRYVSLLECLPKTRNFAEYSHRCNYSGYRFLLLFIVSCGRIGRTLLKKHVAVGIATLGDYRSSLNTDAVFVVQQNVRVQPYGGLNVWRGVDKKTMSVTKTILTALHFVFNLHSVTHVSCERLTLKWINGKGFSDNFSGNGAVNNEVSRPAIPGHPPQNTRSYAFPGWQSIRRIRIDPNHQPPSHRLFPRFITGE